ncbi:MAG: methyltransferase [Alphaproteobacteria bacterium]|nr:MAG: methyltransferase [Alphaproteobacteria bacterium]
MKFSKRNTARALALAALSGGVAAANAAAMTLPAELTEAVASVATIGAGVFAIMVGIKLFKWLTRAL